MKNREIIYYIDCFCARGEEFDTCYNADLAYAILAHGYLYVRPGKPTERFTTRVIKAFKTGAVNGFDNYLATGNSMWPLEEWIRISMASDALEVAKEFFDKRYFEKQTSRLDVDENCDDNLLNKYLNLMSKEQLLDFMRGLSYCRAFYLAFTPLSLEVEIQDELHERCRKMNSLLPEKTDVLEYLNFRENNPYYMADYLNNEEIVDAIKRVIVCNKGLAGHVARVFYRKNSIRSIESYVELISAYERVFGKDIYDPNIFYEPLCLNGKEVISCENQT